MSTNPLFVNQEIPALENNTYTVTEPSEEIIIYTRPPNAVQSQETSVLLSQGIL